MNARGQPRRGGTLKVCKKKKRSIEAGERKRRTSKRGVLTIRGRGTRRNETKKGAFTVGRGENFSKRTWGRQKRKMVGSSTWQPRKDSWGRKKKLVRENAYASSY